MSNTPSDEELDSVLCHHWPAFSMQAVLVRMWLRDAMRAALAKWSTPQPVVREPLTPEQTSAMSSKHPAEDLCGWSYRLGIADAEAHHGIKGKEAIDAS